jgi:CelD/BcsL family acetyltransferase involved in cellulose biosynthesis
MPQPRLPRAPLLVQRARLEDIPRDAWDRLLGQSPGATPFSSWTFQRAWWDAYGETSRQHYLVVTDAEAVPAAGATSAGDIRAIAPLMRRPREDGVGALFMAATYHADYATILAHPADLAEVAALVAHEMLPAPASVATGEGGDDASWDIVDLRRLREADPALAALRRAMGEAAAAAGWRVREALEDVCPVVTLAGDWDAQLARLSRKGRHEMRRKIRRAERAGPLRLRYLPLDAASVDHLIALHQARWGEDGLFTATADGERGRAFLHRLAELEASEGPAARFHLADVQVGDRVVYALAGFDDGETTYFYNAGMDPGSRDLSPGVVGTAAYIGDRIAAGRRRFDFLRGHEAYKYEWGALDEPIHQLIATRLDPETGR